MKKFLITAALIMAGTAQAEGLDFYCMGRASDLPESNYAVTVKSGLIQFAHSGDGGFSFKWESKVLGTGTNPNVYFIWGDGITLMFDQEQGRPLITHGGMLNLNARDAAAPTRSGDSRFIPGAELAEGKRWIHAVLSCFQGS
ncbi:hypothetical protein WDW37_04275 [Bdellovibrionota bacterium FG-1]